MIALNFLPTLALSFAILSAVLAAFLPIYFASRKPGYSHIRHTISELGEIGSPVGKTVSYFGFMAIGISVWVFLIIAAYLLPQQVNVFFMLSLVGFGYVGGGIFRCDEGAPITGTWSNKLHNFFGVFEYIGAAAAFMMLERSAFWVPLSQLMFYAGVAVLVCLAALSVAPSVRGLIQRIAETLIFGGIVLIAWWVYRAST